MTCVFEQYILISAYTRTVCVINKYANNYLHSYYSFDMSVYSMCSTEITFHIPSFTYVSVCVYMYE